MPSISSFLKFFTCKSDCHSDCNLKCFVGPQRFLFKMFSKNKLNDSTTSEKPPLSPKQMPPFANLN